jgi:hypothetical protein
MLKPCSLSASASGLLLLLLLGGCLRLERETALPAANEDVLIANRDRAGNCPSRDPFGSGLDRALSAARLAQNAQSQREWHTVILYWMQAIEAMQAVPFDSPKRPFAQKKVQEYQGNLAIAQQRAAALPIALPFASFESDFLNEQLLLYLSYTAAVGTPDILIVGSSRAIQGIDPSTLQAELMRQGERNFRIFNFGVNGATAQVVDLMIRELLSAEQLPRLIIWADGSRAFNSGRPDRTYTAIAASAGYQNLQAGEYPFLGAELPLELDENCQSSNGLSLSWLNPFDTPGAIAAELSNINANGFLAVENQFNPATYYQRFPKVSGRYDSDYQNFDLWGVQTVAFKRLVAYTQAQNIPLVFANLPLTSDYLDPTRQQAEQKFRSFMQFHASELGFTFVDFSTTASLQNNNLFADPSHLNQFGARAVAESLARSPQIQGLEITKLPKQFNVPHVGGEEKNTEDNQQ